METVHVIVSLDQEAQRPYGSHESHETEEQTLRVNFVTEARLLTELLTTHRIPGALLSAHSHLHYLLLPLIVIIPNRLYRLT